MTPSLGSDMRLPKLYRRRSIFLRRRFAAAVRRWRKGPMVISPQSLITALYCGLLGRQPDAGDLAACVAQVEAGLPIDDLVRHVASSTKYRESVPPDTHEAAN